MMKLHNAAAIASLLISTLAIELWAQPSFRQQDLFISGIDGVNIYRIPALIVTAKGTILAFCEAREGDDGDPTDLVLKRSRFSPPQAPRQLNGYDRVFGYAINWEPMRVVLAGNGEAAMNPCPVIDRTNGAIWTPVFKVAGGLKRHLLDPLKGQVLILNSMDDGLSWSRPIDITSSVGEFTGGSGIGIQLRDGRLVIPGYGRNPNSGKTSSKVIYSDDHGKTWRAGACVAAATDESQVVELSDGTLMLNMRGAGKTFRRHIALSRDRGETWFKEYDDENLPEPRCQASILRYTANNNATRNLLLFSNPPNRAPTERTNLTIRVSHDEGKNWTAGKTVHHGPGAYSSLAVLADGSIGILYETGTVHPYEKITFAQFNLEWLLDQ